MLSNSKDEEGVVKTVMLARGTRSGASSPIVAGTPSSGISLDGIASSRSFLHDGFDKSDPLRKLLQISVFELLDQDDRPTFIVDIMERSSLGATFLPILYANNALRGIPDLLDRISGESIAKDSGPEGRRLVEYHEFKHWIYNAGSTPASTQSYDPPSEPSSISHGGFGWSYSTLRSRFRVVHGIQRYIPPSLPSELVSLSEQHLSDTSESMTQVSTTVGGSPPNLTRPDDEQAGATGYFDSCMSQQIASNQPQQRSMTSGTDSSAALLLDGVSRKLSANKGVGEASDLTANEITGESGSQREVGFFDWTRLPVSSTFPSHIDFARKFDWASTSLGPIEYWSPELRQMCNLVMASPHPAATFWGDDLIIIYNEAYTILAGQKHPHIMGQPMEEAWEEIWDDTKEYFMSAKWRGQSTMKDDDRLFVDRMGFLEEAYFSWSIIPVVGSDGSVLGLYNPAFEKTRRKVAERRMITIREVGERIATAREISEFWTKILQALATNEYDTPFVLLYSVSDELENSDTSIEPSGFGSGKNCKLVGTLGIPENHPVAPAQIDLTNDITTGFGPIFKDVMKSNDTVVIAVGSENLSEEMLKDIEWRGFGEPCRDVVVCPISPTAGSSAIQSNLGESVPGFIVIGVNPRRPYDHDYSLFIQLLSRQVATSLASVMLLEEEIRRGQHAANLAAIDKLELSEQLAARTQEVIESETKFTRMTHLSPAGLFIADSDGHVNYCNEAWSKITKVERDADSRYRWIDSVNEEDQPEVKKIWRQIVEHAQPVTAELRFKQPAGRDGSSTGEDTWVLFSASPEKNADGTLKSVFGSITNISSQKWAETFQKRKMEEAVELKRQQENFIDITSHEMRNPLSAILQCAEEISSSLSEYKDGERRPIDSRVISDCIDSAQTISLCAMHQKRIVDDILTFSKLDSAMLVVTPVDVQPVTVVQRALRMFEGELHAADIKLELVTDDSLEALQIDWVRLDPSRVLQVLINLTTNAIKFTSTQEHRTIRVVVAVTLEKPSTLPGSQVQYFPSRSKRKDMTTGPEWGDGDVVFVRFSITDTGRGLSAEEMKMLFMRFQQLNPRTHVKYGGSGLGLFISRELAELQGGEIGVASESGKGSTFAFYVKARQSTTPSDPIGQITPALAQTSIDSRHILKKTISMDGKSDEQSLVSPGPKIERTASLPKVASNLKMKTSSISKVPKEKPDVAPEAVKADSIRVLICEDNKINQQVLKKQLERKGCTVYVSNHGGEAIEFLRSCRFWKDDSELAVKEEDDERLSVSVILMDLEMPVMDGLTCVREIRRFEREGLLTQTIPVIAVTANARMEQMKMAREAGMDDIVIKPFRVPDLINQIGIVCAQVAQKLSTKNPAA